MFKSITSRIKAHAAIALKTTVAFVLAVSVAGIVGCTQPAQNASEEKAITPSEYMIQLNATSGVLGDRLKEFAAAVADNDTFGMQAKAEAAYQVLDEINNMEAPEALNDVKAKYADATAALKSALGEYVTLYLQLDDAQHGTPFDYGAYPSRIESIQKQYDEGLNLLEEADKMASEV